MQTQQVYFLTALTGLSNVNKLLCVIFTLRSINKNSTLIRYVCLKYLACVAGRRAREGTGRRGGRNGLQGRYCFLPFLRPPDERKNPDWSDLINYLIRHPEQRPVIQAIQRALVFSRSSHIHSFNMADGASDRFEVLLAETLRSLEGSGLKFALKAEQKKTIRHLFERKDVLAVLPTEKA